MEAINVQQLLDLKLPKQEPIIDKGLLMPMTRMFLYGRYKSMKSMLAVDLAFSIARGIDWLEFKTKRSRVLYVQMEIPIGGFRDRIVQYCNGTKAPDNLYFLNEPYMKLDKEVGLQAMEKVLTVVNPQVLIIDPLYKVLSGNISEHQPVEHLQSNVDYLRDKYKMSIIIVCHTRQRLFDKNGCEMDMGADEIMGNSNWPNWADSIVKVTRDGDFSPMITVSFQNMRNSIDELMPIRAEINKDNLHWRLVGITKAGY